MKKFFLVFVAMLVGAGMVWGQTQSVNSIGATSGWRSDDTRNDVGANLVGLTLTHYGKPGQTPTAADDNAIRQQLAFVVGPGNTGALRFDKVSTAGGGSKSTISKIDVTTGFATGDSWLAGFILEYRYYTSSTVELAVPKIGIQSANWAASQAGFTAQRSGESAWDLILVDWRGTDPGWTVNTWATFTTDKNTVCWRIYRQVGNTYHPAAPSTSMSLQQIFDDPVWGPKIFGAGAKVTSFQLGVGSSAQTSTSYIDYVITNLLNGGNKVDFMAPVVNVTRATEFSTIQAAINDAATVSGDVIQLAAGTHLSGGSTITVNKSVTIQGAGEANTMIDVYANGASWGIHVSASNVTLKNFTINPATTANNGGYPIHVAPEPPVPGSALTNITLEHIAINGSKRTGIDLHGVDNSAVSYITSTNATGGNGIQITSGMNVTLSNITTSGNAWGGIAIYVSGPAYLNRGSDNITINGATCSLGEAVPLYTQVASGLTITNVHANGFTHIMKNETYRAGAADYVHYFLSQAAAIAFATGVPTPQDSYIISLTDGSFLVAPLMKIQTAANKASAGGVINVLAGLYEEQLDIGKALTLTGAGMATTTIKSPATLTTAFTTGSGPKKPVVYIHDNASTSLTGFTIDGAGRGNANYQFLGIAFRNAGGSVSQCTIKDIRDTPFSGSQHGVAIYSFNDNTISRLITVANNTIIGFQKNAMALNAGNTTPLAVDVHDNTITGAGATTVTAQNGVQVNGVLATGTVANNTVTGIAYDNTSSATKWVATSILNFYGNLTISNNTVTDGHMGLYCIDASSQITANNFTIKKVGVSGYGIIATDPPEAKPSPFDVVGGLSASAGGSGSTTMATLAVVVNNNTVAFSGPDNTGTIGIEADAGYGVDDINFSASGNTVSGFETGVGLYHCTTDCASGVFTAMEVHNNSIVATSKGLESDVSYLAVNATCNWWGTAVQSAIAAKISGNVQYVPFLSSQGGACTGGPVQVSRAGTLISGHTSIIDAHNAPTTQNGDVIIVAAGTYTGSVTITKSVTLRGAGAATTIVDGGGAGNPHALRVNATGVTISGFTFKNAQTGLMLAANSANVSSCSFFENVANGVLIENASYCVVRSSTFHNNPAAGIAIVNAKQNTISSNTFGGGSFPNGKNISISGTGVNPSRNNTIRANTFLASSASSWNVYITTDPLTTAVNFNIFQDARTPKQYIYNSASAPLTVNARYNWFDGISPPDASGFSGSVNYANSFATDPTVSIFPESQYVSVGAPVTIDVMGLIPAGIEVKGSTIDLNWSNNSQIPYLSGPVDGGFFDVVAPVPGNPFFASQFLGASSLRVDQALLNNPGGVGNPSPGMPYLRSFFSITFQPNASGTSVLTLPTVTLRDPTNAAITPVVILPAGGATLIADGDAPVVTNVVIDNTTLNTDQNGDTFDDFVKNGDAVEVRATVTDNSPLTAANITADLSGFGGGSAVPADSYVGTLATWTLASVTCTPANGPITVTVTATDVVSLTGSSSDAITSDNIAPLPPTAFVAKTDNTIGGHEKVALSWTAGSDANPKATVIRYNGWSYPTYPAGSPASYPALPTDGSGITVTPMTATSATHSIVNRNIYYYSAFTLDWAGNYSAAPTSDQQDRAANYFLGDIGSGGGTYLPGGGYDGNVNFDDLIWFSNLYFTTSASWNPTNRGEEVDFGPTVANKSYAANHRFALPRPDGAINFEDLMIFSMNYMNTTPKIQPPANPQIAREFAVELMKSRTATQQGEMLTVTVRIANDGRSLKGLSTTLSYDPWLLQYADASPAGLFGSQQQGFFFSKAQDNTVVLDATVLGIDRAVQYSGNLATLRFRVLQAGQGDVTIDRAVVRNSNNTEEIPVLNNNAVALPTTFDLAQNYPNPFNPSTRIDYQVPVAGSVTIEVFNILGAKVATLVNEVKDAGHYYTLWNGRNDANQNVASGLYFYTMRAGDYKSIKKMMLMK